MKRIINTTTIKTVWRGSEYLVDGIPATVEPPLYLLTDATRPAPAYDAAIERLQSITPFADLGSGEWVTSSYDVVALTSDEIAENAIIAARKTWPNAAAFLGEFTMPELAAISLSLDPTIAALRLLLASWPADVWSDDPRIQMGLDALVSAGVIDSERQAAIVAKAD
jgi:hypothetical protein